MVALLMCLASLLLDVVCATPTTFVSCSGSSCYSLVKHQPQQQHLDFNAASTACEKTGGHLAIVDTEGEAELLGRLMRAIEEETHRSSSSSSSVPRSSSPSSRKSSRAPEYWMGLRRKGCRMDMKGPLRGFSWLARSEARVAASHYENWLEQGLTSCTRELCASLVLATADAPPGWKSRFCKSQAVQGFVCEHPVGVRVASGCGPLSLAEELRASTVRTSAGTARYRVPWDDRGAVSPLGILPVGSKAVVVCGATSGGGDGGDDDDDYDIGGGDGGGDVADGMANAVCSGGAGGDAEWKVSEPLPCLLQAIINKDLSSSSSTSTSSSSMSPTCPPGFEPAQGRCEDVDECARDDPCQQQGLCTNTEGGFVCDCVEGYQLVNLTECEDIDECEYEPCDEHCVNTDGSYECTCPRGYQQDKSGLGCHDVDECDLGAHACHHVCNNTEGGYECSCDEGWHLEADNVTCTPDRSLLDSTTTTTMTTTTTDRVNITSTESTPNLAFHVLLPVAIALVLVVIVVCAVAMVLLCCRGSGSGKAKRRRQEEEEEQAPQGEKKNEYVWLATQGAAQGVKEMPRPSAPTQVHHEAERELKPRGPDDVDETRHSKA
uniref:Complement component C1q receptor-like n=1 Tax=Petromyzon marinus TaxID=7757 RepID=A0AAJ7U5B2_PETMA|nr:complement component C1q receptor-like [Petromyzon marinus]